MPNSKERYKSRYKVLWLNQECVDALEEFMVKAIGIKSERLLSEIARKGILFAVSRSDDFKEFIKGEL